MIFSIANDSLNLLYSSIETEATALSAIAAKLQPTVANRQVLITIYLRSQICREVCGLYPRKATSGKWSIADISNPDEPISIADSSQVLRSVYAQKSFRIAQTVANIIGSSVLMIDDGFESSRPATKPIALHLMLPEQLKSGTPEDGFFMSPDEKQIFHESRVLIFHGIENPFHQYGWGSSRLAGFLEAYDDYRKATKRMGKELCDRSVFTLKKKDLERQLAIEEQQSILKKFFITLRKGLDTLGIVAIDKDTMEAEWKERSFTDVDVPLSELRRVVIAESDIPEMELFGSQDKSGLSEKGSADRLIVATKAIELQSDWEMNLDKLKRAIEPNPNAEIILGNPLLMSPLEEADIDLKKAQAEKARAEVERARAIEQSDENTRISVDADETEN
jgi:hypothetical protein